MGTIPKYLCVLQKASWLSEFIKGRLPHCMLKERQWTPSAAEARRHNWQKAIKSNTTRAKWKHAGRELQGKVLTATAYGCSLASWMLQQRRSVANLIPTFGFQYCAPPERKGQYCHTCSNTPEWHWLGHGDLHQNTITIWESFCALYQSDLV